MNNLIFWQNCPSIHQAPLIKELARTWHGGVMVVTEWDLGEHRLNAGWHHPDFASARLFIAPTSVERARIVQANSHAGTVHIFTGFKACPENYRTLKKLRRSKAILGVFAEPGRYDEPLKSKLRFMRYTMLALSWRSRLDFLLATGQLGVSWYKKVGFYPDKLYNFGYFTQPSATLNSDHLNSRVANVCSGPVRLLYVGQLIRRKGLHLLFQALAEVNSNQWHLDLVGDGPEKKSLHVIAKGYGFQHQVKWRGNVPNDQVHELMAQASVLILPSIFDGWGGVVNEAMLAGIPVIVSDACGASDLIGETWRGAVFQAGSVESLRGAIENFILAGPTSNQERARISAWALATIAPEVAARYLIDVIESVRGREGKPSVPWFT